MNEIDIVPNARIAVNVRVQRSGQRLHILTREATAQDYANVTVFCMEECRNNIGEWPMRHVEPPSKKKDSKYYAAKDLVMFQEAKCGVMLWDSKSKGTLQNMLNLVGAGKRTLVYFQPAKEFRVLASEQDLQSLLSRCSPRDIDDAARKLGLKTPLIQSHLPLTTA